MYKRRLTKAFLEKLYHKYNKVNSVNDPIWNVIRQKDEINQEILAFISAVYAFGNISQINFTIEKILKLLEPFPLERILDKDYLDYLKNKTNIYHRFLFHEDFIGLMNTLNYVYSKYGSLKKLFLLNYIPEEQNLKNSIIQFSRELRAINKKFIRDSKIKLKFLYPSPESGSPCKRLNLFLRWMVRKDNIDLGLWNEIKTLQLIIPLDTHIFQAAKYFGLTKLKNPSWNMAVEITESLKKFDPIDPVKYDFALSHLKLD